MIDLSYVHIFIAKIHLKILSQESISISDSLNDCKGKATQTEKEIIELLEQICNTDLPNLFKSSENLLTCISDEFHKTEKNIISGIEKVGE